MGHRQGLIGRRGGIGSAVGLPVAAVAWLGRDGVTGVDFVAEVGVGPAVGGDVGRTTVMGSATAMGSAAGVVDAGSPNCRVEATSTAKG